MTLHYYTIWHPDYGYYLTKANRDTRGRRYTFGYDGSPTLFKTMRGANSAIRELPDKVRPRCQILIVDAEFEHDRPADGDDLFKEENNG